MSKKSRYENLGTGMTPDWRHPMIAMAESGWDGASDPEFDALTEKIKACTDPLEREKLLRERDFYVDSKSIAAANAKKAARRRGGVISRIVRRNK